MKASDMYICLEGVRLFARHGVDPQETAVGSEFVVDLRLRTDFARAAQTDCLEATVSYADVYRALREEMSVPARLLEHVCERIARRLFNEFPAVRSVDLRLCKVNPPMGAECRNVGVEVHYEPD